MRFENYLKEEKRNIAVKKGVNKSGKQYAIIQVKDTEGYVVYARSENYKLGRIVSSWGYVTPKKMDFQEGQRYATQGVSYEEALSLFNKKIKGKAK